MFASSRIKFLCTWEYFKLYNSILEFETGDLGTAAWTESDHFKLIKHEDQVWMNSDQSRVFPASHPRARFCSRIYSSWLYEILWITDTIVGTHCLLSYIGRFWSRSPTCKNIECLRKKLLVHFYYPEILHRLVILSNQLSYILTSCNGAKGVKITGNEDDYPE